MPNRWNGLLVLALLSIFTVLIRLQTFGDPVLGFDEQYYLLVANQMLHGAIPYVDIWDRKPIGLFLIYAFAIKLGSDPFLQYKLLAAAFIIATAFLLYRAARRHTSEFGALTAAAFYVLWLNFMEGEGGQSPVFYNLPMLIAALLTQSAVETRQRIFVRGCLAMLLAGIAIQIKYTVIFEGIFFGIALLWACLRAGETYRTMLWRGAVWVAIALAPSAIVLAYYAAIGETGTFFFANFLSIFGRKSDPAIDQLGGLVVIILILAPLAVPAVLEWRRQRQTGFLHLWAASAVTGVLAMGSFLSPACGMPVLAPLCLCAAPFFARTTRRSFAAMGLLIFALIAGQLVVRQIMFGKGGRTQALEIAAAARPHHGCIWVYDGYPALYMLAHSCVPTRWAFPGHLNTSDENSVKALGVDPATEVRRILATRPDVIVDDYPAYRLGNAETRRMVQSALDRSYRLAAKVQTGTGRYRLVYRLK